MSVSILGLGASGMAATRLARIQGEEVYVSELRVDSASELAANQLRALGAHVDLGRHDLDRIGESDWVVVSPGIPPDAPVLRALRARGQGWVSEPEFAVRFFQGSLIAVTGTNGKTTTAAWTAHLLQTSGIDALLGGNVGANLAPPASELALRNPPPAWYVLEMSSFQLADIQTFSPDLGVVTSLAPDHLDRYPSVEAYYQDKAHLFQNASPDSRWVLNGEDEAVRDLPGAAPGERFLFALDPSMVKGHRSGERGVCAFERDGMLTLHLPGQEAESLVPSRSLPLLGRHNRMNALAAALTARLTGAGVEGIRAGLESFQPLPHRLQPVGERHGVLWVNDSKATNVQATVSALRSLDRPVVVLLGGKDKGEAFAPLAAALAHRAHLAVLYGEASDRMHQELQDAWLPVDRTKTQMVQVKGGFEEAVRVARAKARPGDFLLLSPACSSFDEFRNYEARGDRFAALVHAQEGP